MILTILLQLLFIIFSVVTLFIPHVFVGDIPDEDIAASGSGAEVGTSKAHASESTVIFLQCITSLELDQVW